MDIMCWARLIQFEAVDTVQFRAILCKKQFALMQHAEIRLVTIVTGEDVVIAVLNTALRNDIGRRMNQR